MTVCLTIGFAAQASAADFSTTGLGKHGDPSPPPKEELTSREKYQLALKHHVLQFLKGSPPLNEPDWCLVRVEVTETGKVVKSGFVDCPENPSLRKAVQRAVESASPFPAPENRADFREVESLVIRPKDVRRQ